MRAQFLDGELFYTLKEAQIMTERWRRHYNTVRPHGSLRGQPPAPETIQLASCGLTWQVVQKLPAGHLSAQSNTGFSFGWLWQLNICFVHWKSQSRDRAMAWH